MKGREEQQVRACQAAWPIVATRKRHQTKTTRRRAIGQCASPPIQKTTTCPPRLSQTYRPSCDYSLELSGRVTDEENRNGIRLSRSLWCAIGRFYDVRPVSIPLWTVSEMQMKTSHAMQPVSISISPNSTRSTVFQLIR